MEFILKVTIVHVFIICFIGCSKESVTETPPIINSPPEIQSVNANPTTISVGERTKLSCIAIDAEGDNIIFTWTSKYGSFPEGVIGQSVDWKAPSSNDNYSIYITVSDGKSTDGDSIKINVIGGCGTSVLYEGKAYNTIKIGNQCWFKENLNVGQLVGSDDSSDNQSNNGKIEKYCFDNNLTNCDKYGGLYQWSEAMQYVSEEGVQGICPVGWHIPTLADFEALKESVLADGNALKEIGQGINSGAGTNSSGFSALLAGFRSDYDGHFDLLSSGTGFLTSTEYVFSANVAYYIYLNKDNASMVFNVSAKKRGTSVRCVRN